jgi:hypothetical protein
MTAHANASVRLLATARAKTDRVRMISGLPLLA